MKTFKDYFCELVNRSGLTPAEISKRSRHNKNPITDASLSYAIRGEKTLTPETIEALAPVLKLTDEEILKLNILAMAAKAKNETVQARFDKLADEIKGNGTQIQMSVKKKSEVPVWSKIKAGSADLSESTAEVSGVVKMDDDEVRAGCFCMLISGESMEGERIFDGDIAFFQPMRHGNVNESDVYAVEVEGWPCWMIKKIRQLPEGKIGLVSAHPKHQPIEIDVAATRISVKGRLIRVVRERGKSFAL